MLTVFYEAQHSLTNEILRQLIQKLKQDVFQLVNVFLWFRLKLLTQLLHNFPGIRGDAKDSGQSQEMSLEATCVC